MGHHVINSPLTFTVKSSSQIKNIEQYAHEVLDEWKRFYFNDHEDNEQLGDSLINDDDDFFKTNILQKDNRSSFASNSVHDLTKFSNWESPMVLLSALAKKEFRLLLVFAFFKPNNCSLLLLPRKTR